LFFTSLTRVRLPVTSSLSLMAAMRRTSSFFQCAKVGGRYDTLRSQPFDFAYFDYRAEGQ
jgi:hypothetical protein